MPKENVPTPEALVDIEVVAKHFDVNPLTVRNWVKDRKCPHFKPSRQILRFRLSEVEAWANQVPVNEDAE